MSARRRYFASSRDLSLGRKDCVSRWGAKRSSVIFKCIFRPKFVRKATQNITKQPYRLENARLTRNGLYNLCDLCSSFCTAYRSHRSQKCQIMYGYVKRFATCTAQLSKKILSWKAKGKFLKMTFRISSLYPPSRTLFWLVTSPKEHSAREATDQLHHKYYIPPGTSTFGL